MIFRDRVRVVLKRNEFVAGTMKLVTVWDGTVEGVVTFMDSNQTFDTAGNKVNSRLRIFLKPFNETIPPNASSLVSVSWGPWQNLSPDGAVEHHYRNGRLDHYEMVCRAV